MVVLVLLGLVVWAVWFVFSARSVGIQTIPEQASVEVLERPALRVGDHWLLRAGKRRVLVAAPGYVSFRDEVEITPAPLQTHTITLAKLPGHLRVTLAPASTGELFVDGQPHGEVPGILTDIPAGNHEIEIRALRYLSFNTVLEIEGKGIEQTLDVTLEPGWAELRIDSVPGSAEVKVDGELLGATPLTAELLAGRRVVELQRDGYKPWQQTLTVTAGTPINLGEVVLAEADGRLALSSTPSAASVTVDGEYRGRTPLELAIKPDESHTLRLMKEGYQAVEQKVSIASGQQEALSLELSAELATVHLETTPATAELLVDGVAQGSATQTLRLPTRTHELTVRAPGHATYQTQVTPRKGVEQRFRIRLKTAAEAAAEPPPSRAAPPAGSPTAAASTRTAATADGPRKGFVKTFAGQELKLFNGGSAMLGSSRRDPGHRANEVQREVRLTRPFYFALREVTNAEYRLFLATHSSGARQGQSLDDDRQPVSGVSWEAAALYCNWLSRRDGLAPFYQIKYGEVLGVNPNATGYRLPTEAEWEWVARVPPQGTTLTFAWGEKYPPQGRSGNYADRAASGIVGETIADYDDGFAVAAPVGSFTGNLRGIHDLDGNVAEWVHDYYDPAPPTAPTNDPLGPATGAEHVIKGASWARGSLTTLRLSYRDAGSAARDDVGFRLARYAQ
jgi:formylglycine-generating enzyme required for sulfatase activity